MQPARTLTSTRTGGGAPRWEPLLELIGPEATGDFMWMFWAELCDGSRIEAYKHYSTRRYIHLRADLTAFFYRSPDTYEEIDAVFVLREAFATLGPAGLGTPGECARASAALARLETAS